MPDVNFGDLADFYAGVWTGLGGAPAFSFSTDSLDLNKLSKIVRRRSVQRTSDICHVENIIKISHYDKFLFLISYRGL